MSAEDNYDGDDGEVDQTESTAEFKPVVELPTDVSVVSGEEEDEVVYKHRCKLLRFAADSKEWKERGLGDVRLLKTKSGLIRVVMRQEKTNKLVLNHFVQPPIELKTNPGSDSTWVFSVDDYSEGNAARDTFAIRFKTPEIANEYKAAYDNARKNNQNPTPSTGAAAKKEEEKSAEPAASAAATAAASSEPAANKEDAAPAADKSA